MSAPEADSPASSAPGPRARSRRPGPWHEAAHVLVVAAAVMALLDSVTTYASGAPFGPTRPRVLALALAAVSTGTCVCAWRGFAWLQRLDGALAVAVDVWVLAHGAW